MKSSNIRDAVFLQVRLDSARFPAKALVDVAGKPLIVRCMEALEGIKSSCKVVLTDHASASILSPLVKGRMWELFAGPKDDVLERFCLAIEHYQVSTVFRATGDNPLVSMRLCSEIIAAYQENGSDYAVAKNVPKGSCIEAVRASALLWVRANSTDPYEREHVCPGIYRRTGHFRADFVEPSSSLWSSDVSVSIDTPEDAAALNQLLEPWYGNALPPLEHLVLPRIFEGADK